MKKNMLGMDMAEWKTLSGLADPYALALAEVAVEAGVPAVRTVLKEDDDDAGGVPHDFQKAQASQSKKVRRDEIARAARKLSAKTRGAAQKAANTPAIERHRAHLELIKHRKTFVKGEGLEGFDEEIFWAVFLEDRGTSAEEFGKLLDLAIENNDEELAIELLAVETQLDELLGAIGTGLVKGAQAVGSGLAKGASAIGRTALGATKGIANAAGQVVGSAAKGVAGGFAPKPAGGGAPAGATPPAGAPPAAPAGASPQAAPATAPAPATAAPAAGTMPPPAMPAKKPGLLGTLAGGIGKAVGGLAKGVGGVAGAAVKGAKAGYQAASMGMDDLADLETFLGEEFGITAEQYVDICDHAFETNDVEMIDHAHQLDEIFAAWRAKKAAAAAETHKKNMDTVKAAVATIKHAGGRERVKQYSKIGQQPPTPSRKAESVEDIAAQIMDSNAPAPRSKAGNLKELLTDQLRFSGYTDEHISSKAGGR